MNDHGANAGHCVDPESDSQIAYVYDGAGTRVSATKAGLTTYFMYGLDGQLMIEQDTANHLREYAYVAGRNIGKKEDVSP
jgi:hypothetical protein